MEGRKEIIIIIIIIIGLIIIGLIIIERGEG